MINKLKCSSCGGEIVFDPTTQKNYCSSCNSYFIINEYENFNDLVKDENKSKCPNCGAQLTFHENTYSAECKYCSGTFNIIDFKQEKAKAEYIIPFSVSLEKFKKSVVKYLSEGEYTPADIFDKVEFISTKGIYISVYNYETSYSVKYTSEIGYNRAETYLDYGFGSQRNKLVKKTRYVTDWSPYSDTLTGSCSAYAIGTSMFDKFNVITEENKKYTNKVGDIINFCEENINAFNFKPYNEKYLAGFEVIPFELSLNDAYEQTAFPKIKQSINDRIEEIMPGDQYRNLNWNGKVNLDKTKPFLKPFWITKFVYENQGYMFIMDGTDEDKVIGTKPFNKEARKEVSRHFLPVKIALCLIPLAIVLIAVNPELLQIVFGLFVAIFCGAMAYSTYKKNKILNNGSADKQYLMNKYLENPDLLFSKKSRYKEEDLSYGSVDEDWKSLK